jgi:hypothetical protein
MMAADSLHAAVHLIVPSGVSFCWPSPCRRACSASASAPHFALPPAQPSNVQASCLERAACGRAAFAGALAARAAAPRAPLPGAPARGKGGRQDKGRGTGPAKPVCTWGGAARGGFVPPWREARANGHVPRALARRTRERSMSHAERRDDDRFRVRAQKPRQRGQSFVAKVLRQAARPLAPLARGGKAPASGPARAWGAATRRRASGRSSRPCRGA